MPQVGQLFTFLPSPATRPTRARQSAGEFARSHATRGHVGSGPMSFFFFLDLDTLWLHRDIHRRRRSHPVRGSGQTECMHHTGSMSHSSFFQSSFVFVIAVAHSATLVGCTTRRLSIVTFRRGPLFHPHARLFFTSLGYTHARYGRSRACAVDAVCSQGWDWQMYRHRGLHRSGDGRGLDVSKGKSCSLVSRWIHVGCVVGDPRETAVDPCVDGSHVGGDGFW